MAACRPRIRVIGARPGRGREGRGGHVRSSCPVRSRKTSSRVRWPVRALPISASCSAHQAVTAASTCGRHRAGDEVLAGPFLGDHAGRRERRPERLQRQAGDRGEGEPAGAPAAVSSAGLPAATTRPASTITTWSARRSASSMKWVVSSTATPSRRSSPISSQVARRLCGSMPAVGSSRKTSSGRPTSAIASDSRCFSPPESRRYGVRGDLAEGEPLGEGRHVERVGGERGDQPQHLAGAGARVHAAGLQHHADPRGERVVVGHRVEAEDPDGAAVGPPVPLADLDGGGLAGAVGAEQRDHRATRDGDADAVDGERRAVPLDEGVDLDSGTIHAGSLRCVDG